MEFQRCDRKKTLLIGLYPARRHLVPVWLTHADKWACDGPLAQNMSNTLKSDLVTVTSQRRCVRRDDSIVENVTWPPGCPAALLQCHARRQPHSHAVTSFAVATLHPSQSIISRSGHDANWGGTVTSVSMSGVFCLGRDCCCRSTRTRCWSSYVKPRALSDKTTQPHYSINNILIPLGLIASS